MSGADRVIQALSSALYRATLLDLPDITYQVPDYEARKAKNKNKDAVMNRTRRPTTYDVRVHMFMQTWGSTATGYGGMGGASTTEEYTIIIEYFPYYCVYFGEGPLAYMVNVGASSDFIDDVRQQKMPDCREALTKYKQILVKHYNVKGLVYDGAPKKESP